MTTRVFTLEARFTRDTETRLRDIFHDKQHPYRNRLIEIQRVEHADKYQEIRRQFNPRLAELDAELAGLIKRGGKKLTRLDVDEKARVKVINKESQPLRKAFNELLRAGNEELKRRKEGKHTHAARAAHERAVDEMVRGKWPKEWKAVATSELAAHNEELNARGASGLPKALYAAPEAELQASKTAAGAACVPCRPNFRRFDGEGKVTIQMPTKHQPVAKDGVLSVLTDKAEFRSTPWSLPETHQHPRFAPSEYNERPRKQFYSFKLRVSHKKDSAPEWIEGSAMAHRPIPDGTITWINLVAKRRGARIRYQLHLILNSEAWERPATHQAGEAVAVHLGWASNGDGTFRVGYALGTDGETYELTLDTRRSVDTGARKDLSGIEYSYSLRSAQDLHFELARAAALSFLKTKPSEAEASYSYRDHEGEHTTCLRKECKELAKWRAPRKLRRAAARLASVCGLDAKITSLWQSWKSERLASGADLFDSKEVIAQWATERGIKTNSKKLAVYLHFWSRKSTHLEELWRDERRQARNRRKDHMRVWWRKLERRYAVAVVADWDITEIPSATRKQSNEDEQTKAARRNRATCAPGEMREIGKQAMGEARWEAATDGEHAIRCSRCGKISRPHPGVRTSTCSCGHTEDRSLRWCKNVLAMRAERAEAAE